MRLLILLLPLILPNDPPERLTVYDAIGAIMSIESNFDRFAHNKKENALGILQIRPIMVREVNLILGCDKYKLSDRTDINKSVEMFIIYQKRRNPTNDLHKGIMQWNGGANGHNKNSTKKYLRKVLAVLNKS